MLLLIDTVLQYYRHRMLALLKRFLSLTPLYFLMMIIMKLQQVSISFSHSIYFLLLNSVPATSGPTISPPMSPGDERQYQIGDILSLNCTSGRSQPRSILTFYINDEAVSMKFCMEIYIFE